MKFPKSASKTLVFGAAAFFVAVFGFFSIRFNAVSSAPPLVTPWTAVGGCGSSAGGASGDAQLKWIGNGVSGALLDCELIIGEGMLPKTSTKVSGVDSIFDSEYNGSLRMQTTSALVSLYYHPPKILDIKLSMPFLFKEGINIKNGTLTNTGPFGDLSLDLSRKFGPTGSFNAGLVAIFPTGNSSIMEGGIQPMPPDNQIGGGLFSASIRGSYNFDFDWGIINLGGTYSGGLFALKTTDYGYDTAIVKIENYRPVTLRDAKIYSKNQTFAFVREGFGARNDAGLYTPDYIGFFADFGIRQESFTHGFSINYSHPLTKGFVEQRVVTETSILATLPTRSDAQAYLDTCNSGEISRGDTINVLLNQSSTGTWYYLKKMPSPRQTLPGVTVQYSIEKSDMLFPLLLGGIVKLEFDNKIIFSGFSAGIGFKFPVY
jgi:hypothetical protein